MVSFGILSLFLFIGFFLRNKIKFLKKLYLPASVVAGLIGFLFLLINEKLNFLLPIEVTNSWRTLPGILINVVFAALFLGNKLPSIKEIWNSCSKQLAYGQIVAWGQYAVGCILVLLILKPFFSIPDVFAGIMPVGFEGGHGTAAGMAPVFNELGFSELKDLTLTTATFGLVIAIILGMILVNWAIKRNYVAIQQNNEKEKINYEKTKSYSNDVIGSLTIQIGFIGIAILIGYLLKTLLLQLAIIFPNQIKTILDSFPIFPLCMLGGAILQNIAEKFNFSKLICKTQVLNIQNISLDYLIIAAISTISIDIVILNWKSVLFLIFGGVLWNLFCVIFLAKLIFKDAWFERAIAELGQSMGVTATGLLLLRTVDPNSKTAATSAFASKQLLHEPFMGGGLWTGLAIPMLVIFGAWHVFAISLIAILIWSIFLFITKNQ